MRSKYEVLTIRAISITLLILLAVQARADEESELAKKLANPIASLISLPFQYNYDDNFGPDDQGSKHVVNIQPVIPITLTDDLNLISRTILPIASEHDVPLGTSESGVGDITQSFFISPKLPTSGGLVWGVGPVFLIPTASDQYLGSEKFGVGPTLVGLKQDESWTFGILANHIWSVAGTDSRKDINSTFLQPFLSYITKTKTTFALQSEAVYDWEASNWNIPINLMVSQLLKVWGQPIQFGAGPRFWVETPTGGAEGVGVRAQLTILFPK